MELLLEHLAPYLSYELKMAGCQTTLNPHILSRWESDDWDIIPVLKPLHELDWKKFIDENHKSMSDAIHTFIEAFNDDVANQDVLIMSAPYIVFKWCLKNHYDVFSLVKYGLAVEGY